MRQRLIQRADRIRCIPFPLKDVYLPVFGSDDRLIKSLLPPELHDLWQAFSGDLVRMYELTWCGRFLYCQFGGVPLPQAPGRGTVVFRWSPTCLDCILRAQRSQ